MEGIKKIMIKKTIKIIYGNPQRIALLLTCAAVIAGVLYSFFLGSELRFLPDEADYVAIASNLQSKSLFSIDGVSSTAYRAPVYPALLSVFSGLGGNIILFRVLNFLLFGGTVYLSFSFLSKMIGPLKALVGAVIILAYPVLFFTAGVLYPQTLGAFLLLLFLRLIVEDKASKGLFLIAGLVAGLMVLTIPTFIYVLPLAGLWMFRFQRQVFTRFLIYCLIPAVFIVGLWSWRNYQVFNAFVFVSSNSGENLLVGNSANTTPNAGTTVDIEEYRVFAANMDEISRDQYFREQALAQIVDHPGDAIKLYFAKVLNYFNYQNNLTTASESTSMRDILMLATYGPLLFVLVLRIVLIYKYPLNDIEWLLLPIFLLSPFVYAVFFTRIRFRLPFDYIHILLIVIFLARILDKRAGERSNSAK
jgi:4-amino-4-deoxy-L-arabinose transferase-like glycosyltransferase